MKRTLAIVLVLMMALGLMAGVAGAEEGVFTVNIGGQPETIDPQMNSSSDGSNYIKHLFEGLTRYEWDGSGIGPGVAESWDISEDGMTWTFHIREGEVWSDGQPVTANDFVYTFKRIVDPAVAAPYGGDMGAFIKNGLDIYDGKMGLDELGVKAIDDMTFEVQLQDPCNYFDAVMAFPTFYPVRQDIIEQYGASWATTPESLIGNGAYKLDSWTMDEEIVMVPNDNHRNVGELVPQRLVFKLIADPMAKITAVRTGEVDWADDLPADQLDAAKAEGIYEELPYLGTYYVNLNHKVEPLGDVRVRKALALALDTEYMAQVATNNGFLPASNFLGRGFFDGDGVSDFHEAQVVIDRSDVEANKKLAQELLAEAGYPNGEGFPVLEYMTNDAGVHKPTAEIIQAQWKEVLGIDIEIQVMDWAVVLPARRAGEHMMARDGWIADFLDASNMLGIFRSFSGNNSTFYNSPEFDELMAKAASTTDPVEYANLLHQAEMKAFGEDFAAIPVYYYKLQAIHNDTVKDVVTYATGEKLFYHAYVAE